MPRRLTPRVNPFVALTELGAVEVPPESGPPFDQAHTYVVDNETMKSVEAMTHVPVTCEVRGQWKITTKGKKPKCNMTPGCQGMMLPPPDLPRRPSWAQQMKRRAEME